MYENVNLRQRVWMRGCSDSGCEAIIGELGLVDWYGLFSRKGFDLTVERAFAMLGFI
jgi:hypothetical protein